MRDRRLYLRSPSHGGRLRDVNGPEIVDVCCYGDKGVRILGSHTGRYDWRAEVAQDVLAIVEIPRRLRR